jgi:hypothetical protein
MVKTQVIQVLSVAKSTWFAHDKQLVADVSHVKHWEAHITQSATLLSKYPDAHTQAASVAKSARLFPEHDKQVVADVSHVRHW